MLDEPHRIPRRRKALTPTIQAEGLSRYARQSRALDGRDVPDIRVLTTIRAVGISRSLEPSVGPVRSVSLGPALGSTLTCARWRSERMPNEGDWAARPRPRRRRAVAR